MSLCSAIASSSVRLERIPSRFFAARGLHLSVLRLDQIHPSISGNKWFKLTPWLNQTEHKALPLLSFGGAWSNHLHALAFAGHRLGIETIGVVRGEPEYAANAMLTDARGWGMRLHFVTRAEYRRRHDDDFHQELKARFGEVRIIPEGGCHPAAVASLADIWRLPALQNMRCDLLVTALGTGGTLAGLVVGRPEGVKVLGVPVLKYDGRLVQEVRSLIESSAVSADRGWALLDGGHQGGYARINAELARTLLEVEARFGLPLDPIYTVKALMALVRQVHQGKVPAGSEIVLLHTGGLQGRRGVAEKLAALAPDFVGPLAL